MADIKPKTEITHQNPSDKKNDMKSDAGSQRSATPTETATEPSPIDAQNRQLADLQALTRTLMVAVGEIQAQNARNAVLQEAVADVKANVKAATKAMLVAPTASVAGYGDILRPTPVKDDCDDCECGCTDSSCCCFEIVLEKVRGIQPQGIFEPGDMGDVSLPIPTMNALEVRFFASIDDIGVLVPGSLWSTMEIRVPSGGGAGAWQPLGNIVVGRVCLKKGTTKNVELKLQGLEEDAGIERPFHFKDEFGEASGSITLNCCMSKIYPPMPIDLSFNQGGIGGGQPGAISLAFFARRVCC